MNMFKKNGGFTLVELIVVIAILAILAAVAVPAYNGYIAKANDSAVLTELTALHTAAQAACSMDGVALESIAITNAGVITVTPAGTKTAYTEFYTSQAQLADLIGKHSVYSQNGCCWLAEDPDDDAETWKAGWNAGIYTAPAAPAPEG